MILSPGRSAIAVGALEELHPALICIDYGMDLPVDNHIWIFQF
jgi:hypothetical protein